MPPTSPVDWHYLTLLVSDFQILFYLPTLGEPILIPNVYTLRDGWNRNFFHEQDALQCFDTVGWATGRTSGLYKKLNVGLLVVVI